MLSLTLYIFKFNNPNGKTTYAIEKSYVEVWCGHRHPNTSCGLVIFDLSFERTLLLFPVNERL